MPRSFAKAPDYAARYYRLKVEAELIARKDPTHQKVLRRVREAIERSRQATRTPR